MSVYGFRSGPKLASRSSADDFMAMMDEPMSLGATFWDQAGGGVLESFGLGTVVREFSLPPRASTRRGRETEEEFRARQERVKGISEDEYKSSPYFREEVPWDAGMTMERAAALATMYDTRKVREYFAEKRPITAFFGSIAGQALDPINYIPIAGPSVRAAAVARYGIVGGRVATGALDAAANTALAGLATRETRRSFGDDVSWQTMVSEIATAAVIGSAFGTVGGVLESRAIRRAETARIEAQRRAAAVGEMQQTRSALPSAVIQERAPSLREVQEARVALNEAIGSLANDGEVRLSPNAVAPIERAIERVTYVTPEDRYRTIERIVKEDVPLGPAPLKPVSLTQFLTSRSVGGIKDEGGELASMGLSRKFVPGGGALVRKSGKSLDYAREAAAEAGYFDHIYGDPDRATAMSTNDDLLRLLGAESRGEFIYSDRADGGRSLANAEYELSLAAREQYRRALEEVNAAISEMGIEHRLDDGVLRRAAELLGEGQLDGFAALERAIGEDYRAFSDAMDELGEGFSGEPGFELPFFGADPPAGGNPGEAGNVGQAGRGFGNAPDREQPPGAGGTQGQARTVDTSPPAPDPIPQGRTEAEARIAKPENYKALADQYRVDPETGSFAEEAELRQLQAEGRLTEEDIAALEDVDAAYQDGAAFGEALKSVVNCLL